MFRYMEGHKNMQIQTREERGKLICEKQTEVKRIDEHTYEVNSQSGNGVYQVLSGELGWLCSCPDAMFRDQKCKHVFAVEFSLSLRKIVEVRKIQPIDAKTCILCGSEDLMKWGIRHNKSGDIQKFKCKECGKFFTINVGFEGMRHNPKSITTAMQLYFSGESFRNTQRSLQLLGVKVAHSTVYDWIQKYVALMDKYLDQIAPNLSDNWRADELYVKFRGNRKYLFAMMDDETRYWIAQEVAHWKESHDTSNLFRQAKQIAGKVPKVLTTDGLKSYAVAFSQEFASVDKNAVHIKDIQIDGKIHNNKMERMNGETRDREKVMRGLKVMDTPILKGAQIYHNYIKPHEGLNGRTPAQACGIEVQGDNKWITLIQNASKNQHNER